MVRALVSPPYRATTLATVSLMSLIAFESMAITTAMPAAARALDGVSYYGVAFGVTLATAVVGIVVSGQWCDRRGPAGPMLTGILMMAIGLVTAGAAPSMSVLILGRVFQGAGIGLIPVAIYVLIGRRFPSDLRPAMFAALSSAWAIPSIVGPPVAGLIAEHLGWRWVFLGVPLLAIPAAIAVMGQVRPLGRAEAAAAPSAPNRPGSFIVWAVLAAGGAGLLHVGGHLLGVLGVVLIGVGITTIVVAATRILPDGTLRLKRGLPTVVALRGIGAAAFFSAEVYIPLILIREHGLSPAVAGLALTAGTIGWTIGSWLQSRFSRRIRPGLRLRAGFGSIAVGVAITATAISPDISVWVAVGGWILAGLGMGMTFPSLAVLLLELSPVEKQGSNSASLQLSDALAAATTFAVTGAAFAALIGTHDSAAYGLVIGTAVLIALLGTIGASRVEPAS